MIIRNPLYANVYSVTRHYGGPEEGGWWYNSGEPIASFPIVNPDLYRWPDSPPSDHPDRDAYNKLWDDYCQKRDAVQERQKELMMPLIKEYDYLNEGNIYSVLDGSKLEIQIEDTPAAHWPERRPHYE